MSKPDAEQEPSTSSLEISQLRRFNEVIMRFLPVGVVVIDRTYRIVTANGMARRLLGSREVGADQDFLHAVHGVPYHQTRTAIDTVFRERDPIYLPEIELELITGGNGHYVSMSLGLVQIDTELPQLAIVSVTDVTQQVQARRQLEMMRAEQAQLVKELGTTNKRLTEVNKELTDTNEGLQVANEELLLTHEELQASIEEFETTNEELQATNEELETNNEELQATNEELETINEELRARTSELQEMTTVLENERSRLAEMVAELAPFYILVLRGPNLIVEAYNSRYASLIENRPVQGRPLTGRMSGTSARSGYPSWHERSAGPTGPGRRSRTPSASGARRACCAGRTRARRRSASGTGARRRPTAPRRPRARRQSRCSERAEPCGARASW